MKNLREFLLEKHGFADNFDNQVYFEAHGLDEMPKVNEFWLFLDEGLRCGGTARKIPCDQEHIREVLLGCGKNELWNKVSEEIETWKKKNDA